MHDQFRSDGIVLDNAMAYWIHRVYQATRNATFVALSVDSEEITPEQWIVLVLLWKEDGRTQTELGEVTYRDRPTMSRILAGMERRGWIRRRKSPENARVFHVYLTPAAHALQATLVPRARALVAKSLRGLDRKDLEITRATLRKMFENLTG